MPRPPDVDPPGVVRMDFSTIHIRPRRGMQDQIEMAKVEPPLDDVPQLSRKLVDRSGPLVRKGVGQGMPQLPARARDQDAGVSLAERIGDGVLQRSLTRRSSQAIPCSSGSAGSYSSVTW